MNIETRNAIDDLRVNTQRLLNDLRLSAARVVAVQQNSSRPVRLIAFDYYGSSGNATNLIDVNKEINVSYFEGDIEVLTE